MTGRDGAEVQRPKLVDTFHRTIDYLRISVTDRCNMRCLYCMPEEGVPCIPREQVLTYEEIERVVRAAAACGVRRLRLTGGEPLVRKDLAALISRLATVPGIVDLALSTNAVLLAEQAAALARAGLQRVNVSLDTLDAVRFARLTRRDCLDRTLAGLRAAQSAGLKPVKINCVAMRGWNEYDLAEIAKLSIADEFHVRFIEVMPLHGNVEWQPQWFIPASDIMDIVRTLGALEPIDGPPGNGPARYWQLPGAKGTVGVITPLSHSYCDSCNRVRLSADGRLRLCLFGDASVDLRTPLREGATVAQLAAILRSAMAVKPQNHNLDLGQTSGDIHALSEIGG